MSSLERKPGNAPAEESLAGGPTPKFWRSLAELEQKPEFMKLLENEFPEQQEELKDPLSRRRFMQLMGASMAFAGVAGTGCRRWEEDKVVPQGRRPEGYVPGEATFFATSMELMGVAQGLLAKSFDGRPVKIEGNPDHPASNGATSKFAQASVLGMYDPDRSTALEVMEGGKPLTKTWKDFEAFAAEHFGNLKKGTGEKLRVLAEASSSPTLERLKAEFKTVFPQSQWHEYEPLSRDNEREGLQMAFGAPFRPVYHLDRAEVVLSVDADLFEAHPDALRNARDFATTRRADAPRMSRLWAAESVLSTTGAMADHRLPLRNEQMVAFLAAIDALIRGTAMPKAEFLADEATIKFVEICAKDLQSAGSAALVAVGYRQDPLVHALAASINSQLGAAGRTVGYVADANRPHHKDDVAALAKDMAAGKVDTLLILGGNPVYDAPADLGFGDALSKVATSIHLGLYNDETAAACKWHLPRAHFLEGWGDARTWNGTVTLQQPLVQPLYDGRSPIELVELCIRGAHTPGQDLVKKTAGALDPMASKLWQKAVHDGFAARTDLPEQRPQLVPFEVKLDPRAAGKMQLANGDLEVVFVHSTQVWDGRFANNAWLQEIPDFISKAVWDNFAMVSPATAHTIGVHNNTMAVLEVGGQKLELPVYVMPGVAPFSVAVQLGYGRTRAGVVAGHKAKKVESIGFDTYKLRTTGGFYRAAGGKLSGTRKAYEIGNTQDHWAIDARGREALEVRLPDLVKEATLTDYKKNPTFAQHVAGPKPHQLWDPHEYDGYRWGMATDLGACTGCSACVVACQSENNIPVVGKKQVLNNREMQWIRIDRYFKGDKENPEVSMQPVGCQQCENAPCEQVCPVGATIHSSEGLNDMVYNRCVGTRYCLNNCPYKVRRFNFLNWNKDLEDSRNKVRKLLLNPEVTVRGRGVMEKCTFCVQRIQAAKITAHNKRERVKDGDIQTACQQACPTGAIVFGDLADENSKVSKLHANNRSYALLGEYLTKPRNHYLARIRNPHPDMPAAHEAGGHH